MRNDLFESDQLLKLILSSCQGCVLSKCKHVLLQPVLLEPFKCRSHLVNFFKEI